MRCASLGCLWNKLRRLWQPHPRCRPKKTLHLRRKRVAAARSSLDGVNLYGSEYKGLCKVPVSRQRRESERQASATELMVFGLLPKAHRVTRPRHTGMTAKSDYPRCEVIHGQRSEAIRAAVVNFCLRAFSPIDRAPCFLPAATGLQHRPGRPSDSRRADPIFPGTGPVSC